VRRVSGQCGVRVIQMAGTKRRAPRQIGRLTRTLLTVVRLRTRARTVLLPAGPPRRTRTPPPSCLIFTEANEFSRDHAERFSGGCHRRFIRLGCASADGRRR